MRKNTIIHLNVLGEVFANGEKVKLESFDIRMWKIFWNLKSKSNHKLKNKTFVDQSVNWENVLQQMLQISRLLSSMYKEVIQMK